jgi:hypothetical protein
LLDRGRGGGLFRPLGHDESFAAELRFGLEPLLRRRRKICDMTNKVVRALLDEAARALPVLRASRLGGCVSNHGSCRFARIGERVFAVAAAGGEDGQVVEGLSHIGVVYAERLLLDRQRAAPAARDTAKQFLIYLLSKGPCLSADVEETAEANGIPRRTLFRAKAELKIVALKDGPMKDGIAPGAGTCHLKLEKSNELVGQACSS